MIPAKRPSFFGLLPTMAITASNTVKASITG